MICDLTNELTALCREFFPPKTTSQNGNGNGHHTAQPLSLSDTELLEKARRAANGADFERLWRGEWEGRYASQSEADLALCCHLAFWFGPRPCPH